MDLDRFYLENAIVYGIQNNSRLSRLFDTYVDMQFKSESEAEEWIRTLNDKGLTKLFKILFS